MSTEETPTPPPTEEALTALAAGVAKLLALVEADDSAEKVRVDSMMMLREILDGHGKLLKSTLSPENKLHPDVSSFNPHGERDHPRPPLKRPCFILGVPIIAQQCTWDEIEALNWFTQSLEIPDRKLKAILLHDSAGAEILYISKPYRNFDDVRELSALGGQLGICKLFQSEGKRADTQDHLFSRITQLEETIAKMQSMLESKIEPVTVP